MDDQETFALVDPKKALAVIDRALKTMSDRQVEVALRCTRQMWSAWRNGKVSQVSLPTARKVRRLARRLGK